MKNKYLILLCKYNQNQYCYINYKKEKAITVKIW